MVILVKSEFIVSSWLSRMVTVAGNQKAVKCLNFWCCLWDFYTEIYEQYLKVKIN